MYEEPRSGRPTKIANHKITEFFAGVKNGIFPKHLVHQIKKMPAYHIQNLEYVPCCTATTLLQRCPDSTHKKKAFDEKIEERQKSPKRWILRAKRDGFEIYVADQTVSLHDYPSAVHGRPRAKKHYKFILKIAGDWYYCAISDSHQYFLQGKKFDGSTFQICQKTAGTGLQDCHCNGWCIITHDKGV